MELQIEGRRELVKALRQIDRNLPKEITIIHKRMAEPIADTARGLAPSITGSLAGTIKAQGSQRVARVAAGSKSVPYAGPIHYGWPRRGIEAQPFLQDALDSQGDQAGDDYERMIGELLDRVFDQYGGK